MEKPTSINYEDFKQAIDKFLGVTNNDELKVVERTLNDLTNASESISCILRSLRSENYRIPVQKMLAVLLKKAVLKNYLRQTPEDRAAFKTCLLEVISTGNTNSGFVNKLAEAYATILKIEQISLADNPELKSFLQTYFNFSSKDAFLKSLVLVQNIAEIYPNFYSAVEVANLITLIEQVFATGYDANNGEIYLNALKSLFSFTNVVVIENEVDASQINTFINKLITMLSSYYNTNGVFDEDPKEANSTLTTIFEILTDVIEFHVEKLNQANLISIIDFIISAGCLNNQNVDLGTKNAAVECLDTLLHVEPKVFNPKKTQTLEKVFKVYSELLIFESNHTTQQIAENSENAIEIYKENKLSDLLLYSIESICLKFKTKNTYKIIKQMITHFSSTGHLDLSLRLLSSTAQALCHHLVKEIELLVNQILIPCLKHHRIDITIYALKSLCYFCEFLAPDVLDYKDNWLEILVGFLRSASSSQIDKRAMMLVIDNSLFALEIIVENCEKDEISKYSMELIDLVSQIMYDSSLDETTKKTAIQTLAAVFSTSEPSMLTQHMNKLVGVLEPCTHHDFFVGEAMIALSKLAYYAYKDAENKTSAYLATFQALLEKAYSIIKKVDNVDDYELYEGAFTVVYQAIDLLGRDAAFVFDADLFFKWSKYLEDSRAEDLNEPLSEQEDESEEDENHLLARLPFMHFCSSVVHYLGLCLRYFTEHLIVNPEVDKEIQNFLIYRILAENEDERHQVYLCAYNYALGVRRVLKSDASLFLLGLTDTMLHNEPSESNISRNIELLKDYIVELSKDEIEIKPLSNPSFAETLMKLIGEGVLAGMYKEHIDPEIFYSVCELITEYIRADITTNYQHFYKGLLAQIVLPCLEFERLECDITIIEEVYGSIAEAIKAKPALLSVIAENFNQQGQFEHFIMQADSFGEEGVTRNAMFLIGTVFEHMQAPMFASKDKIELALQYVQSCYEKYELVALKENCISSFVKLYLNKAYSQFYSGKLNDQAVLEAIRITVPLKGDDEETESILKGLLVLANNGHTSTILSHKNIILFIFEGISKHQTLKLDSQVLTVAAQFVQLNQNDANLTAVFTSLTPQSQETIKTLIN